MKIQKNTVLIGALALVVGLVLGHGITYSMLKGFSHAPSPTATQTHSNTSMQDAMSSMTEGLQGKTGDTLDNTFLDEMIVHHQGAVQMAQTVLLSTKRPEIIKLANDIIAAQTQEIKMMSDWRKLWFNN